MNTPVELYPHRIRYVDLEVDVVRRPGEPPVLIDQEDLQEAKRHRLVLPPLYERALEEARRLMAAEGPFHRNSALI